MKGRYAPSLLVIAFLFTIVSVAISAPEQKKSRVSPTFTKDSKAQVSRGGAVTVTLVAIPSYGNIETFEIQIPPSHGLLSDLKNTSDHSATVIYHHDGSKSPLQDMFVFRAKAPGQSVSSPAKVMIEIISPPPLLIFEPQDLDFGKVLLSEKRGTNVLLTNLGGGRAIGRIIFPSGFSSTNGGGYNLLEGESVSVSVEFSPMEEKVYGEKVACLPPADSKGLQLRGSGLPRFEVTAVGQAAWNVRNLSTNQIRIAFLPLAGTAGWILPPETILSPGSDKAFTFLREDDEEAVGAPSQASKVRLTDGLTEASLELPAPRRFIPLTLQSITPTLLGRLPLGGGKTLSFSLLNRSDMPKRAFYKITSALGGGMNESSSVELQSGETKKIHYNWIPSLPGEGVVRLTVEEGKKTSHEILWTALISRGNESGTPLQIAQPQKLPESISAPGGEAPGSPNEPAVPVSKTVIPPVNGATVEVAKNWLGVPRVIARWEAKPVAASKLRLQECLMVPRSEEVTSSDSLTNLSSSMMLKLQDLHHQSLQSDGKYEMAVIQGLRPGWHLIMISQTTTSGDLQAQSQVNVFVPRNPTLWGVLKTPMGILSLVLLILVFRRVRRGT